MKYKVDRITEQTAVLENENGEYFSVTLSLLPERTKEGSVLDQISNQFFINDKDTQSERERIFRKQKLIFKKK